MPQLTKQDRPTPEQIEAAYRAGYMTAGERNDKMRRLARATLDDTLAEDGFGTAILRETVKNLQAGWDNIVEGATKEQEDPLDFLKGAGQVFWGQVQILTSAFNAIGTVTGKVAENMALSAGASPGLAKVINVAVDVGTGFVPLGVAVRSGVKGVQAIGQKVVGKAAKGAEEAAEVAAKEAQLAEKVVDDAIKQGLEADGVAIKGAGEFVGPLRPQDEFAQAYKKFLDEMRGVTETKSFQAVEREASKLGLTVDDIRALFPGKQINDAEVVAYLKALDVPIAELRNLALKGLNGEPGALERMGKMMADDFFDFVPKFRSASVTGGRVVKFHDQDPRMKSFSEMLMGWDADSIAKGDFGAALRTMAEDIVAMTDDAPAKMKAFQLQGMKALAETGKQWWGYAREAYVNLLLARPITWVRQTVGNTVSMTTRTLERELAGWMSIDDVNGVVKHEGWADFRGKWMGLGEGLQAFGDAFRKVDPTEVGRLDFVPHKIPGVLGRIFNAPGDIVRGLDNFTRAVAARGDHYATALRNGTRQGLKGDDLSRYVAERAWHPTQEMIEHGKAIGQADAFMSDLGTFGQISQKIAQWGPLALYFPFWRSPINLLKWGWYRTPGLQFLSSQLYKDILAGGELADMAIARLTLSNMVGQFIYGMHQQGLTTGGGPADAGLRRSWLATKQPYSIMGKDGWHPLGNVAEPGTTVFELINDFAEIRNQLDDPTAEQTGMAILLTITRDVLDNTWWRTMGDLVRLTGSVRSGEEVERGASRIITSPLAAVTTGGPFGQAVERAIDPVRRETRTWIDDLRKGATARVFGFHKDMPAMRDMYGDEILPPVALGGDWVGIANPVTTKGFEDDPIKLEGTRLQVKGPQFPYSLGGKTQDDWDIRNALPGDELPVELTLQERDRWQVIYRNILRSEEFGVPKLMNSDEYKGRPWAHQRQLFMNQLAVARKSAKDALLAENLELRQRAVNATVGKQLPLLLPTERQQVEQQTGERIDLMQEMTPEQRDNLNRYGILDSGEGRDQERRTLRLNVEKPLSELNKAASGGAQY